jgi:chaperonin GroES
LSAPFAKADSAAQSGRNGKSALQICECQKILSWLLKAIFAVHKCLVASSGVLGGGSDIIIVMEERMGFRPLHDRVVVRRIDADEKTAGGIIIPDTAKEKPSEGEIVAVGPGARNDKGERIAPELKAGDRVLFGKWSGTEVRIAGEDLLIMKESDILGVIEGVQAVRKAA